MKILQRIVDGLVSIGAPSRALSQKEALQMQTCGSANAGEMPSSEQTHFYGLSGYSQEFTVNEWVHHGSVLSPLLFITVLEALSFVLRYGAPWEDIYADHLVIITESLEELDIEKAMEEKGLRVNAHDVQHMSGPPAEFR